MHVQLFNQERHVMLPPGQTSTAYPNHYTQLGASLPTGGNYQMAGNTIVIPYLQTTPFDNHVTVYDPTDAKQYSDMLEMLKRVTLTRDVQ